MSLAAGLWRSTVFSRLMLYARLARIDRPIGILLLLWPTLSALWLAAGAHGARPPWSLVLIFVVGTALMRSAGCAINDWADRDLDGQVKRTAGRVLATGQVTPREALGVAVGLALLAALLLPLLNAPTIVLAFVAVFIAATYPLFKRFFPVPQAYLGVAFSFGIPMAFTAVNGMVGAIGWWFFVANLFWVVAYDTEYAMVDRDDDLRVGIRSSAVFFGRFDVAAVMLCYAVFLSLLLFIGAGIGAGPAYYAGWLAAAGCVVYHYRLIRTRTRAGCFRAFLHNNWTGAAVFAGIAVDTALRAA